MYVDVRLVRVKEEVGVHLAEKDVELRASAVEVNEVDQD